MLEIKEVEASSKAGKTLHFGVPCAFNGSTMDTMKF